MKLAAHVGLKLLRLLNFLTKRLLVDKEVVPVPLPILHLELDASPFGSSFSSKQLRALVADSFQCPLVLGQSSNVAKLLFDLRDQLGLRTV